MKYIGIFLKATNQNIGAQNKDRFGSHQYITRTFHLNEFALPL